MGTIYRLLKSNSDPIPRCSAHLAVDEGDAVAVAGQMSNRLRSVLPQRPPVPHLAQRVVTAREEQLGRAVGERHRIHVVLVGINLRARRRGASVFVLQMCMCENDSPIREKQSLYESSQLQWPFLYGV